jgi:hypothetical protein
VLVTVAQNMVLWLFLTIQIECVVSQRIRSAPPLNVHVRARFALMNALVDISGLVIVTASDAGLFWAKVEELVSEANACHSSSQFLTLLVICQPLCTCAPAIIYLVSYAPALLPNMVGTKRNTTVGDERKSSRAEGAPVGAFSVRELTFCRVDAVVSVFPCPPPPPAFVRPHCQIVVATPKRERTRQAVNHQYHKVANLSTWPSGTAVAASKGTTTRSCRPTTLQLRASLVYERLKAVSGRQKCVGLLHTER